MDEQVKSVQKLAQYDWIHILPGHGRWAYAVPTYLSFFSFSRWWPTCLAAFAARGRRQEPDLVPCRGGRVADAADRHHQIQLLVEREHARGLNLESDHSAKMPA